MARLRVDEVRVLRRLGQRLDVDDVAADLPGERREIGGRRDDADLLGRLNSRSYRNTQCDSSEFEYGKVSHMSHHPDVLEFVCCMRAKQVLELEPHRMIDAQSGAMVVVVLHSELRELRRIPGEVG